MLDAAAAVAESRGGRVEIEIDCTPDGSAYRVRLTSSAGVDAEGCGATLDAALIAAMVRASERPDAAAAPAPDDPRLGEDERRVVALADRAAIMGMLGQPGEVARAVLRALDALDPNDRRRKAMVAHRLAQGAATYGALSISDDPRDWVSELEAELWDALVYCACWRAREADR